MSRSILSGPRDRVQADRRYLHNVHATHGLTTLADLISRAWRWFAIEVDDVTTLMLQECQRFRRADVAVQFVLLPF